MHNLHCSSINLIDQLLYNLKYYQQELRSSKQINCFIKNQLIELNETYELITNNFDAFNLIFSIIILVFFLDNLLLQDI